MENNKYYIPTEEDFYVGATFEKCENPRKPEELSSWRLITVDNIIDLHHTCKYHMCGINKYSDFRIRYLDKEDIFDVTRGFPEWQSKFDPEDISFINVSFYVDGVKYELYYTTTDKMLSVQEDDFNLFLGTVKNKSEFKRVLRMLNID